MGPKEPAPRNSSGTQTARGMAFEVRGEPALQGSGTRRGWGLVARWLRLFFGNRRS